MKITKLLILSVILTTVSINSCFSCVAAPPPSYHPLWYGKVVYFGLSPRASGMAKAFGAVSDDVTAFYWNPAGASFRESSILSLDYSSTILPIPKESLPYWYGNETNNSISAADIALLIPFKKYTVGFCVTSIAFSSLSGSPDPILRGTSSEDLLVSYKLLDNFSVGAVYKATKELYNQGEYREQIFKDFDSFDVGALYKYDKMNFGISIINLNGKAAFEGVGDPMFYDLGTAWFFNTKGILTGDIQIHTNNECNICSGIEYHLFDTLFLRVGYRVNNYSYDLDETEGLNYGLGLNFWGLELDYSQTPDNTFKSTSRLSLSIDFSKFRLP